jgi:hypothetical protein
MYRKKRNTSIKSPQPATPVLLDMLNARIQYIHAEPYQQSPMIETGTIIEMYEYKGTLRIRVQPDSPRLMAKWRDADKHLLHYIHDVKTEKATA